MDIAIIGAGNVGKALASASRRAGHSVTLSSASGSTAAAAAAETGVKVAADSREAVEGAGVVIIAVPYPAIGDVLDEVGSALAGKVVIDATNTLKPDYSGLVTEGKALSGAEEMQARVPEARVAKAFNTVLAARQAEPTIAGVQVDGFVAADDERAKAATLELAESIGLHPIDAGPLAMARYLEAMAFLNISLQLRHGWSWQSGWKLVGPEGNAS